MVLLWKYDDLLKWINEGCDLNIGFCVDVLDCSYTLENIKLKSLPIEISKLTNLTILYCNNNEITYLQPEINKLTKLTELHCNHNKLKNLPSEIGQLYNLTELHCHHNQLNKLPSEIGNLTNLTVLVCSDNQLIKIPPEIGKLTNLSEFYCSNNKLVYLPHEIGQLINLTDLICNNNKLTSLPQEIGQMSNLNYIECYNNKIKCLPSEIGQLHNLIEININNNKLKTLPFQITQLLRLYRIFYNNNPIEYLSPQVVRFINNTNRNNIKNIYNDTQNIHNHHIQIGITNSINYITSLKPSIENLNDIILNLNLDKNTKMLLFEYISDNTVHSILNVTFSEVLLSVLDFILEHPNKDTLLNILENEMSDSFCKCFTGRLSILINVLNGFDDNIKIHISESEQIGGILAIIRNNNPDNFIEIATRELQQRGYNQDIINEWLS